MQFTLSIESFNVNNTGKENSEFEKYNIDVKLDEIANTENSCVLKYGYAFMSSPKGIRLDLEGTINLNGSQAELERMYQKDEQNIPHILRQSYHELYPVLFMITKSMNIPCPPYEISKTMDISNETTPSQDEETISDTTEVESTSQDTADAKESEHNPFESLSTEELTQMQIEVSKEHSEKPSKELKIKLEQITETLNKKINESVMSTQNVS